MSDVVNAELLKLATDGAAEEYWHACADPALKASKLAAFVKFRLQAEAPEDAEVAEIAERRRLKKDEPADLCDWDDLAESNGVLCRDIDYLLAKLRAITSAQAEAQAPTTQGWHCPNCGVVPGHEVTFYEYHETCGAKVSDTAQAPTTAASVLTGGDRELLQRIEFCLLTADSADLWVSLCKMIDRLVGAPAPAPTMVDMLAEWLCDKYSPGLAMFAHRSFKEQRPWRQDAMDLLALIAKGDTP